MANSDPMTGQLIGSYEINGLLGRGGMGSVYQGRHVTLERNVAVKFLAPHLSHSSDFVARFLREARAAARLHHPNIIEVYDAGAAEGVYYFVMEYVDGQDLGKTLKNSVPFSEAEASRHGVKAAYALAYAHKNGIIHRDIKPENLILSKDGELKVADLGLAKQLNEQDHTLTQSGTVMGSPYYISPEQIRGAKHVDARTDIYSLGASLFHMVTGKVPYSGSSAAEIMSHHLTEPLPWPQSINPKLSQGFCRVLYKMMAKDPKERFQSMDEVAQTLEMALAGKLPELPAEASVSESGISRGPSQAGASNGHPPESALRQEPVKTTSSSVAPVSAPPPFHPKPSTTPGESPELHPTHIEPVVSSSRELPRPNEETTGPTQEDPSWLAQQLARPGPAQLPWGVWMRFGIAGMFLLGLLLFWMHGSTKKTVKEQSAAQNNPKAEATNEVARSERPSRKKTDPSRHDKKSDDNPREPDKFSRYSTKRNLQ